MNEEKQTTFKSRFKAVSEELQVLSWRLSSSYAVAEVSILVKRFELAEECHTTLDFAYMQLRWASVAVYWKLTSAIL